MTKIGTSILRDLQQEELSKITLQGSILDLGGSKNADYHKLINGDHTFTVVNIDDRYGYDLKFNIEEKFPLADASYDNVLTMNLIEHIFDTHNIFSEVSRVIKPGGLFVSSVPYMHQIHGSPDDYVRYTDSAYKKFAEKYGFEIVYISTLGTGIFSLIFQIITIYRIFPFSWLYNFMQFILVSLDKILLLVPYYKKLVNSIPLGYFWVMRKK